MYLKPVFYYRSNENSALRTTVITVVITRALEPEPELGAGALEPGFFRGAGAGAGALCEIQVELKPELELVVQKSAPDPRVHFLRRYCYWRISHNLTAPLHKIEKLIPL